MDQLLKGDFRKYSKGQGLFVGNPLIWMLFGLLLITSAIFVTSASASETYKVMAQGGFDPNYKHYLTMIGSIFLAIGISRIPPRWLRFGGLYLYTILAIVLVLALLVIGAKINGATRWIRLPLIGFLIQPSEFFKIVLIAWGAVAGIKAYRARREGNEKDVKRYFYLFWGLGLAAAAGFFIENGSTGILFGAFIFFFSIVLRPPTKPFLYIFGGLAALGAIALSVLLIIPQEKLLGMGRLATVQSRILKIGEPLSFVLNDSDRQAQYAKMAIANGQGIGRGIGKSKMKDLLPMADSDLIYAVIVEEAGFVGMLWVPLLYVSWFVLLLHLARRERNRYRQYLLYGIGLFLALQVTIHLLVSAGIIMTGQPLPLISKGGSSMLLWGIVFGIMASISNVQTAVSKLEEEAKAKGVELPQEGEEHGND